MKLGYVILGAFLVSFALVLFGEAGLLSAYKLSQENARLEARIDQLQEEKQKLLQEIEKIQTNSAHLEHVIRKNLTLVAPDEIVYEFEGK